MLDWIAKNKTWVFDGIGVFVIGWILKLLLKPTTTPIIQAPVLNITTQIATSDTDKTVSVVPPKAQAPIFGLNPVIGIRNIGFIDNKLSNDGGAQVCIARFRLSGDQQGFIHDRFEASIDYVEHLSASGIPYDHRAAHVNRAQWLAPNNGDQELLLAVEINYLLYAVSSVGSSSNTYPLLELDLRSTEPFVRVILTELITGRKWHATYRITYDPHLYNLAVREISSLRPTS